VIFVLARVVADAGACTTGASNVQGRGCRWRRACTTGAVAAEIVSSISSLPVITEADPDPDPDARPAV
jgi:hypothetical protein